MLQILFNASYETIKMVFSAAIFTIILGIPLGLLLEATENPQIWGNKYLWLHNIIYTLIDFITNVPVYLILIGLIPIVNNLVYESFTIQLSAAISLGIIGGCIFGKETFKALHNLPVELSDTAKFLGAEPIQVLTKFLLPQATQKIIESTIRVITQLISLSIMTSMLGIEGLGKVALEKCLQETELFYLFYIIIVATGMIYLTKFLGFLLISYTENKYHSCSSKL